MSSDMTFPQQLAGGANDISFVDLSAICDSLVLSLWILVSKLCVIEFESQRTVVLVQDMIDQYAHLKYKAFHSTHSSLELARAFYRD